MAIMREFFSTRTYSESENPIADFHQQETDAAVTAWLQERGELT